MREGVVHRRKREPEDKHENGIKHRRRCKHLIHFRFMLACEFHHWLKKDRIGENTKNEKSRLEQRKCSPFPPRENVCDKDNDGEAIEQKQRLVGYRPNSFIEMLRKIHSSEKLTV